MNNAFHAEEGKAKKSSSAPNSNAKGGSNDKWVSNYVPYGEYPKGESAGDDAGPEQSNGDAAWKKNYVAYSEETEEVDNKNKE